MGLDFRPRAGSQVDQKKAGAYTVGEKQYWIPGRQEWRASVPVPPHQTKTAKPDLDLMFLPAYGCDTHTVYLGSSPSKLEKLGHSRVVTTSGSSRRHSRVAAHITGEWMLPPAKATSFQVRCGV